MSEMTDFDKLLNDINRLNEQDQHDVYILSKGTSVPFKPLTLKQQKEILSSTTRDSPTVEFVNVIDQIITDNCMDLETQFYNCDRSLIVLQLRAMAVGDTLDLYNKNGDKLTVNIPEHVEHVKKSENDVSDLVNFTIKNENIKIECEIPTLELDATINNRFKTKSDKKSTESFDKLIGDVYVYETLKYIKSISTQQIKLDFHENTDIESQIKIMESMPVSVCNDIVKQIKRVRDVETEVLKSESLNGMMIPVDATLFTGE